MEISVKAGKSGDRMKRTRTYPVVKVATPPSGSHSRLVRWAERYGKMRLSRSIQADHRVVLTWLRPNNPTSPLPKTVRTIIALSQLEPLSDGPLTYEDFYGPVSIESHTEQTVRRTMMSPRQIQTRRAI